MASAIALREDFSGPGLRRLATASRDAARSRRLLAVAEIHDGGARSDAARIGGVGLRVIRDRVLRFNAGGPGAPIDREAPGRRRKLNAKQRRALTPSSFSIRPLGTPPTSSRSRPTSPFYPCRRGRPSSIRSRTSGSSCATTGCPTGFSNHTTTSSPRAARPGTRSSINRGPSCPSAGDNGRIGSNQCRLV